MSAPEIPDTCSCGAPASTTPREYGPVCNRWPCCGWPLPEGLDYRKDNR